MLRNSPMRRANIIGKRARRAILRETRHPSKRPNRPGSAIDLRYARNPGGMHAHESRSDGAFVSCSRSRIARRVLRDIRIFGSALARHHADSGPCRARCSRADLVRPHPGLQAGKRHRYHSWSGVRQKKRVHGGCIGRTGIELFLRARPMDPMANVRMGPCGLRSWAFGGNLSKSP